MRPQSSKVKTFSRKPLAAARDVHAELSDLLKAYSVFKPRPDPKLLQAVIINSDPNARHKSPHSTEFNLSELIYDARHDNALEPPQDYATVLERFGGELVRTETAKLSPDHGEAEISVSVSSLTDIGISVNVPGAPVVDGNYAKEQRGAVTLKVDSQVSTKYIGSNLRFFLWDYGEFFLRRILVYVFDELGIEVGDRRLLAFVTKQMQGNVTNCMEDSRSERAGISVPPFLRLGPQRTQQSDVSYRNLSGVIGLHFLVFPVEKMEDNTWRFYRPISIVNDEYCGSDSSRRFQNAEKWARKEPGAQLFDGDDHKEVDKDGSARAEEIASPETQPGSSPTADMEDKSFINVRPLRNIRNRIDISIEDCQEEFAQQLCAVAKHRMRAFPESPEKIAFANRLLRSAALLGSREAQQAIPLWKAPPEKVMEEPLSPQQVSQRERPTLPPLQSAPKSPTPKPREVAAASASVSAEAPVSCAIQAAKAFADHAAHSYRQKKWAAVTLPPFIGEGSADAKKYERRLQLNRSSAAASRVRREAYTKALEAELVKMEEKLLTLEKELSPPFHARTDDTDRPTESSDEVGQKRSVFEKTVLAAGSRVGVDKSRHLSQFGQDAETFADTLTKASSSRPARPPLKAHGAISKRAISAKTVRNRVPPSPLHQTPMPPNVASAAAFESTAPAAVETTAARARAKKAAEREYFRVIEEIENAEKDVVIDDDRKAPKTVIDQSHKVRNANRKAARAARVKRQAYVEALESELLGMEQKVQSHAQEGSHAKTDKDDPFSSSFGGVKRLDWDSHAPATSPTSGETWHLWEDDAMTNMDEECMSVMSDGEIDRFLADLLAFQNSGKPRGDLSLELQGYEG